MAKKRRTRAPRMVLLDTREPAQLQTQVDELSILCAGLRSKVDDLGNMLVMLKAELSAVHEIMGQAVSLGEALKALAARRSEAARRANETRRQAASQAGDNGQAGELGQAEQQPAQESER